MGTRSRRDPEGRRRAIIAAAADLIVELGFGAVTHRKVADRAGVPLGSTTQHFATLDDLLEAALEHLVRLNGTALAEIATALESTIDRPRTMAVLLSEYLSDPVRVRTETALYVACVENPRLAVLTTTWHQGLVAALERWTDHETAVAVAIFGDGLMMHVSQGHELPSVDAIARTLARLLEDADG